ncbi:predicted protein [Chaetoceros tenuissimus]|uniref:Leucine zipper transcription factor-like protein 1 n=1 Tax=Chaetoceros tenuissimus TaxID=426638 RepID=A0AAD3CEU0_9STRA|nr:predicted protein [Chaetoceros tenuissimus]
MNIRGRTLTFLLLSSVEGVSCFSPSSRKSNDYHKSRVSNRQSYQTHEQQQHFSVLNLKRDDKKDTLSSSSETPLDNFPSYPKQEKKEIPKTPVAPPSSNSNASTSNKANTTTNSSTTNTSSSSVATKSKAPQEDSLTLQNTKLKLQLADYEQSLQESTTNESLLQSKVNELEEQLEDTQLQMNAKNIVIDTISTGAVEDINALEQKMEDMMRQVRNAEQSKNKIFKRYKDLELMVQIVKEELQLKEDEIQKLKKRLGDMEDKDEKMKGIDDLTEVLALDAEQRWKEKLDLIKEENENDSASSTGSDISVTDIEITEQQRIGFRKRLKNRVKRILTFLLVPWAFRNKKNQVDNVQTTEQQIGIKEQDQDIKVRPKAISDKTEEEIALRLQQVALEDAQEEDELLNVSLEMLKKQVDDEEGIFDVGDDDENDDNGDGDDDDENDDKDGDEKEGSITGSKGE